MPLISPLMPVPHPICALSVEYGKCYRLYTAATFPFLLNQSVPPEITVVGWGTALTRDGRGNNWLVAQKPRMFVIACRSCTADIHKYFCC